VQLNVIEQVVHVARTMIGRFLAVRAAADAARVDLGMQDGLVRDLDYATARALPISSLAMPRLRQRGGGYPATRGRHRNAHVADERQCALHSFGLRIPSVNAMRLRMSRQRVRGDARSRREDLGNVAQQSRRSAASSTTSTGNTSSRGAPHSAVIRRSGWRARSRSTVMQLARWIVTPLPRVTKPTMPSGGAGLQQRARTVIRRSTPRTLIPLPAPAALLWRSKPIRLSASSFAAAGWTTAIAAWIYRVFNSSRRRRRRLVRVLEAGLRGNRIS
jgi:hypothetical protein